MKNFKDILTKLDPKGEVLTESAQNELATLMEEKEKKIAEDAFKRASKLTDEKIKKLDEVYANKLKDYATKMDADRCKKMREVVEAVDKDHAIKFQKAMQKMEEGYAAKFEHAIKVLEESHCNKLKKAVNHIDADRTTKLKTVIETFEKKANNDSIVESVSNYLDTYISKTLPEDKILKEEKFNRMSKIINSLKEELLIDDEYIQEEVKEALVDAKTQMDEKDQTIDKLMMEKVELNKKIEVVEAKELLESKIKDLPLAKQAYLGTLFKESNKTDIEERFDEAVKAFEEDEAKKRAKLTEDAKSKQKINVKPASDSSEVKTENKKTINESKDNTDSVMNAYTKIVKKTAEKGAWN